MANVTVIIAIDFMVRSNIPNNPSRAHAYGQVICRLLGGVSVTALLLIAGSGEGVNPAIWTDVFVGPEEYAVAGNGAERGGPKFVRPIARSLLPARVAVGAGNAAAKIIAYVVHRTEPD